MSLRTKLRAGPAEWNHPGWRKHGVSVSAAIGAAVGALLADSVVSGSISGAVLAALGAVLGWTSALVVAAALD